MVVVVVVVLGDERSCMPLGCCVLSRRGIIDVPRIGATQLCAG